MITLPIGTYFFTLNHVFSGTSSFILSQTSVNETWLGNSTFAGATAAVMANVVLIAYVVVAMKEDQSERQEEEEKKRKSL